MLYVLLLLEGIMTFISPCLLPLLPVYISFFAAGKPDKRRTIINALGFVAGFSLIYVTLGAFAGTIGRLLIQYMTVVNIVAGIVIIILGLNLLGVINIHLYNHLANKTGDVKDLKIFSAMIFGSIFAVSCSPCVGAFLGAALMKAATGGSTATGAFMLLIYSIGLGIPFIISALLIDRLKGIFDFIKRNNNVINIISGTLLILMGILMATGLFGRYLSLFNF